MFGAKQNPWRDFEGHEIKDFVLKAEENLPIYKKLHAKKYHGDTTEMNKYFEYQKARMTVFHLEG